MTIAIRYNTYNKTWDIDNNGKLITIDRTESVRTKLFFLGINDEETKDHIWEALTESKWETIRE